ncbi:GLPGLI family protein [Neolewinella agarilytica]|uniref:GLPGLI family protein n=1 Tax=Neolewinella agarilytica TaxID=478744 RepID=UPI00235278AB|nr:GLPGLI family protein [Neolewinella agarilytica]
MRIFTTLLLLALCVSLFGQVKYGQIEYLQTNEMSFSMDGEEDEEAEAQNKQIREMIAKMSASGAFNKNYTATFSPTEFNCVQQVKPPAEMRTESAGGAVMVVMTGGDDPLHYYTQTENNTILNKDMIMDKAFLVSGEEAPLEWTITDEKVAPSEATVGLDLKIATAVTPLGDTLIAGFAPSVPVQVGPKNYYGLPGAIITLEIPNGKSKTVFRATKITLSPDPLPISQPEDGKKISLEKFRAEKIKRDKTMRKTKRTVRG